MTGNTDLSRLSLLVRALHTAAHGPNSGLVGRTFIELARRCASELAAGLNSDDDNAFGLLRHYIAANRYLADAIGGDESGLRRALIELRAAEWLMLTNEVLQSLPGNH